MPRPKSDIDKRILRAARTRFLAEGVDGASLRQIAEDAETSIGMVYYYFPTKDDLFSAVVEEGYERVLATFEGALAPQGSVPEKLTRLYEAMGKLEDEQLIVLRLVLRETFSSHVRLERLAQRFLRGHIPLVLEVVKEGQADGTFERSLSPWLVLMNIMAFGALPQVVPRMLGFPSPAGPVTGSKRASLLVDLLLHGIQSRRR
jgi:AcrR family transcriptional regulator